MATLLDGKAASKALLDFLSPMVETLDPKLVVVQVGDDPASSSYIKRKIQSCEQVGMRSEHMHLPANTSYEDLMETIQTLNADDDVTGFIVQLPLPHHLQEAAHQVSQAIDPRKDVDGFGPANLGNTFLSTEYEVLPPATPAGIIRLLEHYEIDPAYKHAVIVGRSNIVGKPLSVMLLNRDATVTVCHSKTEHLSEMTKQADILVAAVGKKCFITADMVKAGATVIDVGIHRTDEGLAGDVDFEAVQNVAGAITPVPGGVGPMTVASLIRNCIRAKEQQLGINT